MKVVKALHYIYNNMEEIVRHIYKKMYHDGIRGCFVKPNMNRSLIISSRFGKEKRQDRMISLMQSCRQYSEHSLEYIKAIEYNNRNNRFDNVMQHFEDINLSPLTITKEGNTVKIGQWMTIGYHIVFSIT